MVLNGKIFLFLCNNYLQSVKFDDGEFLLDGFQKGKHLVDI